MPIISQLTTNFHIPTCLECETFLQWLHWLRMVPIALGSRACAFNALEMTHDGLCNTPDMRTWRG